MLGGSLGGPPNLVLWREIVKKLLLCCLIFMTGCSVFVKSPQVQVKDVNVVSLDGGGAGIEFYLAVTNPNAFGLKLEGYSYDLKVLAMPLAKGGARQTIEFPAKSTTDVRLPVRIAYGDMLEVLKRRPDPDRIPYQLRAGFDLDTPVGALAVPVDESGTYAIPERFRPSRYMKQLTDYLGGLKK